MAQKQPSESYNRENFFVFIVVVAFVFLFAVWSSGGLSHATNSFTVAAQWAWKLFLWMLGVLGLLSAFSLFWWLPVAWKARQVRLHNLDTALAKMDYEIAEKQARIDDLRSKTQAMLLANHAKNQALMLQTYAKINEVEARAKATLIEANTKATRERYVVQGVSGSKSVFVMDTNLSNPVDSSRLVQHVQHALPAIDSNMSETQTLPNIVDEMVKSQRMVLIAPSGSGKTNLLKHYVSRIGNQKLFIVDPHSPNHVLGCDVIGGGLNFKAIETFMLDKMFEVSQAYEKGDIAQDGDMGEQNQIIVIDEWREIYTKIGDTAIQFLKEMMVRFRKKGIRILIINQNDTRSSWGLDGDMGLLKTAVRYEIHYDQTKDSRTAYILPDWTKANRRELAMPGVFEGYATVTNLVESPTHQYNHAQRKILKTLIALNGEAKNLSKREILRQAGVGKNGRYMKYITDFMPYNKS